MSYARLKQKHRTDPKYFLNRVYNGIKLRCTSKTASTAKYYYGRKYCSKSEFIKRFINDEKFLILFKKWSEHNYIYEKTPSIDRIDKEKDYIIENMQFMSLDENCGKEKEKLPILMFDLQGNFIKEYPSKWAAHKELNIPNGNICKVVYGIRKSAGGYVFKFKKS